MTTTTTTTATATTTINIISALPKWVQWSLTINGTPDGWVPCYCLGLTTDEISTAFNCNIIDIDGLNLRFIEENVITIYNWLQ